MDFLRDVATLYPKQLQATAVVENYKFTLFGGSAGPGKTEWLVATAAYLSMLYGRCGVSDGWGALMSGDERRVIERFIPAIRRQLVRTGLGEVRGATKDAPAGFHFHDPGVPPILFMGLRDVATQKRGQFLYAGIDELTEIAESQFHETYWRVRCVDDRKPLKHDPVFAASNPDGPYASWVYEYFYAKTFSTPLGANIKKEFGSQFAYVPALLEDNPNADYVASYREVLKAQPEHLRRAREEGIWDLTLGARFAAPPQVVDPFEIPPNWQRFRGIDWGANDPFCCVWIAFDEARNAYVYRRVSESGLSLSEAARIIRAESGTEVYRGSFADPTMWSRDPVNRRCMAQYFIDEGVMIRPSTNRHEHTNPLIERYLLKNDHPDLYIFSGAAPLAQDLRAVRFDNKAKNPENLVPHEHTHGVYALGYALHGAYPTTSPETEPEVVAWQQRKRNLYRGLTRSVSRTTTI